MPKPREFETIGPRKQVVVLYDKLFSLYIIKGDQNFLVDCGVTAYAENFRQRIVAALQDHPNTNHSNTTQPDKTINTLLLTHSHWDHAGAAHYFQQAFGFNVMASQRAVFLLNMKKVTDFIQRLNHEYDLIMGKPTHIPCLPLENMQPVFNGDTIPLDSESHLEVIETPGHTKCSISYLLHPDKILFPGDSAGLLEPDGAVKPIFLSNYKKYEASIEKLIALEAEFLAFSHNRVIRGKERVHDYLQASLSRAREVKNKILEFLEKETDIDVIAEKLYQGELPRSSFISPKEAMVMNLKAMIKTVAKQFMG